MNESLIKYLAGLLDADGSLSFTFKEDHGNIYVGLVMSLASSDAVDVGGFVSSLPTITGMGTVQRYGANQQFIAWRVSKRAELEMLLPRLIKHMVIKAKHWQWLLSMWRENRTGQRNGWVCNKEQRQLLAEQSRQSRKERVGPNRPKNHPTWAWLAGYLDGDGCYTYRKNGQQWHMKISALCHANDKSVLDFLHSAFGGQVANTEGDLWLWTRSLGYHNRDFALGFLPHLAKHSRLKRPKIDAMIHHHRQRLSVPGTTKTFCQIENCQRPTHGNGLCSMHYQRNMRQSVGV